MTTRREAAQPLLQVERVSKTFGSSGLGFWNRSQAVRAVDNVSFDVASGEALGVVGESGSGKTTAARMIVRLVTPTSGRILYDGEDVALLDGSALRAYRRRVQLVFQSTSQSLNPRRRVRDILADGLAIHHLARGEARTRRIDELLELVGLRPDMASRFPHQFSSGQRQRIGIARALSVGPELLVADEPVSALDVSVQAQILNLIKELQTELGLTLVFISHDLRAVNFVCDRIAVMYLGKIMEVGPRTAIVNAPVHPYTRALLAAAPTLDSGRPSARAVLAGDIADAGTPESGCPFAPRCSLRARLGNPAECSVQKPPLIEVLPQQYAACHFAAASIQEAAGSEGLVPPGSARTGGASIPAVASTV